MKSPDANIRFFSFLFLCYFIVFAVSPLTYPFLEKNEGGPAQRQEHNAPSLQCARVLLWELLMKKFSDRAETARPHGNDTIIIKKMRALVPEDRAAILPLFETASGFQNSLTAPAPSSARAGRLLSALTGISKGFALVYAGHAPPAA